MARLKSQLNPVVEVPERDYHQLIEASILLKALKIMGIEKTEMYKGAISILKSGHVEIHLKPVKKNYR